MPSRTLQPFRRTLALLACTAALGGCLGRNAADTTGSLANYASLGSGASSDADLLKEAETLGRSYEANPADAEAALAYGRVLRARGQVAQALAVLQQATLRNPGHLGILGAYGKILADAGRFKEAADVLARAHRPDRPEWRILSVQGAVADQLGDFAGAQRYYEAALRIAPGEPSVLSNQGLSFALVRRLDEAERVLTEAARHPRADERVRRNLALVQDLRTKPAGRVAARLAPTRDVAPEPAAARSVARQPNSWQALRDLDGPPRPTRQAAAE